MPVKVAVPQTEVLTHVLVTEPVRLRRLITSPLSFTVAMTPVLIMKLAFVMQLIVMPL